MHFCKYITFGSCRFTLNVSYLFSTCGFHFDLQKSNFSNLYNFEHSVSSLIRHTKNLTKIE